MGIRLCWLEKNYNVQVIFIRVETEKEKNIKFEKNDWGEIALPARRNNVKRI